MFKKYPHLFLCSLAGIFAVFPLVAVADTGVIEGTIQTILFTIVVAFFGTLVRIASYLLDFGINTFVIGFGDAFLWSGVGVAVNNVWVIIRDFVNLGFIFGFVYIGFKMILSSSDSNTRRWLVNIILAALLVNFSLFATKFVIDMSNQLAAQIATNAFVSGQTVNAKTGLIQVNTSYEFMQRMGLNTLLGLTEPNGWGYIFGSAIMFMVAAFVFAAGGILLIVRFAVLNLFMVLSPLMFLGWVLPPLGDTMKKYWSGFFGRAFFAPVYLLFLYFSLQIISGLQRSIGNDGQAFGNSNWSAFQRVDPTRGALSGDLGTIPFFILICIFLAASLWAANKIGADLGGQAIGIGRSLATRVRKTAVNNSAGFAARGVNRLSAKALGGYENLDARLSTSRTGRYVRGAATLATLGALSDKNVKGALGAGQKVRIDGSETADEVDKMKQDRQKLQNKTNDQLDRSRDFAVNHEIVNDVNGVHSAQAKEDARNKLAQVIKNMSDDELKDLGLDTLNGENVARHLSDAQIKMLKESGLYSNTDIKTLKTSRDEATFSQTDRVLKDVNASAGDLDTAFESLAKTIKGLSEERLQNMSFDRLKETRFAANLSESQMESLQKSGNFTPQQMQEIRSARESGISATVGGTATQSYTNNNQNLADKQKERLFSRSSDDIGKLPVAAFSDPGAFKYITPAMVESRIKNGISLPDKTRIRQALADHLQQNPGSQQMWTKWRNSNSAFAAQFFS